MTDNCNKPNALLGHLLTSFNMWNHDYIWNSTPITPTAPTVTWQHLQIVFCLPNSLQRKWMRMEFILLLNIDFRKRLSHFLLYQLSVWNCPFLYGIEHNSSCLLIEVTTFFSIELVSLLMFFSKDNCPHMLDYTSNLYCLYFIF